jgi:hypothetical protein
MLILVNSYLAWRHRAPTIDDNTIMSNIFHVDAVGFLVRFHSPNTCPLLMLNHTLKGFAHAITIQQCPNESANTALLHMGLLGCFPLQPTIAIHIKCLKLYYQIQYHQSSFSIQAITKVLCMLHNVRVVGCYVMMSYSLTIQITYFDSFAINFLMHLISICKSCRKFGIMLTGSWAKIPIPGRSIVLVLPAYRYDYMNFTTT